MFTCKRSVIFGGLKNVNTPSRYLDSISVFVYHSLNTIDSVSFPKCNDFETFRIHERNLESYQINNYLNSVIALVVDSKFEGSCDDESSCVVWYARDWSENRYELLL